MTQEEKVKPGATVAGKRRKESVQMSDRELFCLQFKTLVLRIQIACKRSRMRILECLLRMMRENMSNSI